MKNVVLLSCLALIAGCGHSSQEEAPLELPAETTETALPVPANAAELERVANLANGGALGCGEGAYTWVYLDGSEKKIRSGLDANHVFGERIRARDLIGLLEARATGVGPMAGERSSLLYVILQTLGEAAEPAAIPAVVAMLGDSSETARCWAKFALIHIGEQRADLRPQIVAAVEESGVDLSVISSPNEEEPAWMTGARPR